MILVIGATGTVGSLLVNQLAEGGHAVRALTRNPAKSAMFNGKVEVVVGDLNDKDSIARAMHGVERFFLVTACTQQDRNALAAAKSAGTRHVVKISTQEAGWTPVRGHGHWHKEREELIRASGLSWTFLRPCMYMSFALSWAASVRADGTFSSGGGDGKLGTVDPWDVAAVAKAALSTTGHENVAYELTGPEILSFGDMANILSRVTGRSIRHIDISDARQGEIFASLGLPEHSVKGLTETYSLIRGGRFAYLTDDVKRATGSRPRTFEAWVRAHEVAFN